MQGTGADVSAGYHGYWITDFTQIDPHLGTNADMKSLIDKAHAKGMKVFFDIITNHTADVIDYAEDQYGYIDKATEPYKDATATPSTTGTTPAATPSRRSTGRPSFPYTPVFRTAADETVKVPAWLNDPTMYHNRGDSTFAGENGEYGDFVGLDDLFTEHPEVVDGHGGHLQDLGRLRHRRLPDRHRQARQHGVLAAVLAGRARRTPRPGNDDFFMFGEVFDADPAFMSQYTTTGELHGDLDFGFQDAAQRFAPGQTATTSCATSSPATTTTPTPTPTRTSCRPSSATTTWAASALLAKRRDRQDLRAARTAWRNELMFLTRGQPVIYYGDEQGFTGAGAATRTPARTCSPPRRRLHRRRARAPAARSAGQDRYDTDARSTSRSRRCRSCAQRAPGARRRRPDPPLRSTPAGIYAFSRIDADGQVEYVVVANNATTAKSATFATYSDAHARSRPLYGGRRPAVRPTARAG